MQVSNKRHLTTNKEGWIRWLFLVVVWVLTISMIRNFLQTKKGFLRVKEAENRLIKAKEDNQRLTSKLSLVSSSEYKEKLIREKLNMQKDDEIVVVLPGKGVETIRLDDNERLLANWEKWLNVLGVQLK